MARDDPRSRTDSIDVLLEGLRGSRAPSGLDIRPLADLPGDDSIETVRPSEDGAVESNAILDKVRMCVRVELGRRRMRVDEAASLTCGDIVDLDRAVEAPVDVYVGELLIARGEIVVVNGRFGVRVTEVLEAQVSVSEEARS